MIGQTTFCETGQLLSSLYY